MQPRRQPSTKRMFGLFLGKGVRLPGLRNVVRSASGWEQPSQVNASGVTWRHVTPEAMTYENDFAPTVN